jgi:hypothetical protein
MIFYGNVVKFKKEPDLYVVKDSKYDGDKLDSIVLIPFNHSNSSTHVSRKHPFKTTVLVNEDCKDGECGHYEFECPTEDIPSTKYGIDEIKYVADNITGYIMTKMKKVMFE